MITRLWLVRHGPTHQKAAIGWTDVDVDLSDTAKIARLRNHLPKDAHLISSDLQRAVKTADAIGSTQTRHPHREDLREVNFGAWERLTFPEIEAHDPDLARAYWDNPGDLAPEGGESWNAFSARIRDAISELLRTHEGQDIILAVHFGVILCALQMANNMSAKSTLAFEIDNLTLTRIDHFPESDSFRIMGVNTHI